MTEPDAFQKKRNRFAGVAIALLAASFYSAFTAELWVTILDYWFINAAIVFGVGAVPNIVGAIGYEMLRVDSLRSN